MAFKLNYDSMAKFDAMSDQDKSSAWDELSPDQQKAIANYFPTYKAEKQKRANDPLRAKEKSLEVIGKALGDADNAVEKSHWFKNKVAPAIDKGIATAEEETRGVRAATLQGLSIKTGDEMEGVLNALLAGGGLKINDRNDVSKGLSLQKPAVSWDDLKAAFFKARDERRADRAKAEKDQPLRYHAAEFLSGMAVPLGGAAKAKTAWEAAKMGAKIGAPLALLSAVGGDEGKPGEFSLPSPATAALSTGLGGVFGGAGAAGGHKLGGWLARKAEEAAVKAAGARGGIDNQLRKMGVQDADDVQQLGRDFLDEGLIPWSGNKSETFKRAVDLDQHMGKVIGDTTEAADKASNLGFDYDRLGWKAAEPVINANAVEDLAADKATKLAEALAKQGEKTPGSFTGAWQAKSSAQRAANFKDDAPTAAILHRKVGQAARDDIADQIQSTLGNKALGQFNKATKRYGTARKAEELASEGVTRDAANAGLGMTELLLGGAGLSGGLAHGGGVEGALTGAAMALASKAAKRRGWGPVARGSDALSELAPNLSKVGPVVAGQHADPLAKYLGLLDEDEGEANAWTEFLKEQSQ